MALNENNTKKTYTKYKRHVDESKERISAETVNIIQDDIAEQQVESNKIKDKAFEERLYTIFNNNLYTNAMFKDILQNGEYVDMELSNNIRFNYEEQKIELVPNKTSGIFVSKIVQSIHGPEIELNDFFVITSETAPIGSSIKYYLETRTGTRWPVLQNALKLPMHVTDGVENGFRIIIELKANDLGESPSVNGYAVLYHDKQIEENYGLINPDLQRFP